MRVTGTFLSRAGTRRVRDESASLIRCAERLRRFVITGASFAAGAACAGLCECRYNRILCEMGGGLEEGPHFPGGRPGTKFVILADADIRGCVEQKT
jgi:hypothetical protein